MTQTLAKKRTRFHFQSFILVNTLIMLVVIVIMLYPFLNTKYQEVLEQYLGPAAAYSGTMCTWHNAENQHTAVSATTAALISDARVLLENAENMMRGMDPYSAAYEAVRQAAATLESIISQESPTQSEVAAAMAMLTQAMAGIY